MTLQPHPDTQPKEPVHTTMQASTDTLHTTQREAQSSYKISPHSNGQESSKLEGWFMDIEAAVDILQRSHTGLAETKSHGLTHTLIREILQAGKWMKSRASLR